MSNKKTSVDANIDISTVLAELAELKEKIEKQEEKKGLSMKDAVDARCIIDWEVEKLRRTWMYLVPKDSRVFFKWLTPLDPEFNLYELIPGHQLKEWVDFEAPNANPLTIYRVDAENVVRYNEMMLGWMPLSERQALDSADRESLYGREKQARNKVTQANEDMEKHLVDTKQYNLRTKMGAKVTAHIDEPVEIEAKSVTPEMMLS